MAKLLNKKEKISLLETDLKSFANWNEWANKHDVIQLNNGELIIIDKPYIENTMYYNDETPAPDTELESFIHYNLIYSEFGRFDKWLKENEDYKKIGCCIGNLFHKVSISKINRFQDIPKVKWYEIYDDFERRDNYTPLSDEENKQFIKIMNELKENFIKRLKTYYKKYPNKITTYGYWANR